ncbi:type IV secretory system conjugative DNA transfer family protein [Corynebacterium mastitidis]
MFSPDEFVRSGQATLYVLSKEGADNAAALTTALTAAVMKAAEEYGQECGGRLPVPLIAALDEAANVVQWPQLPALYSHYGSRGIILCTILQSYMQGEKVWGKEGMELLWSAASMVMVGSGIRDEKLLGKVEALIGDYEQVTTSVSRSRQGRSVSQQVREKKIVTVAELASMEAWRVVLFAVRRRPMIVALEPWWERAWPKKITGLLGAKTAGVVDKQGREV